MTRAEFLTERARKRARERGAALFIVVMVTVLLGAIGVYAVRASSQIELASGYSRLWAQAGYVSDVALRTLSADMAGKEHEYYARIMQPEDDCRAVKALYGEAIEDERIPCLQMNHNELQANLIGYAASSFSDTERLFQNVGRPGTPQAPEAAAFIEITDLGPAPDLKAGMNVNGKESQHWRVTLTSLGQVRPAISAASCNADMFQASGVQATRAHVTFMTVGAQ